MACSHPNRCISAYAAHKRVLKKHQIVSCKQQDMGNSPRVAPHARMEVPWTALTKSLKAWIVAFREATSAQKPQKVNLWWLYYALS